MRVLLAAHPTVGHTQALRAVAAELRRRGHHVIFLTSRVPRAPRWLPVSEPLRAAAELLTSLAAEGPLEVVAPTLDALHAGGRIASARGYAELEWALRFFTADVASTAARVTALVRRERVDLVVADFAFFAAWLGAEKAGVPHVAVFHSGLPFPTDDGVPFGSGLTAEHAGSDEWHRAHLRLAELSRMVDDHLADARSELSLPRAAPQVLSRPYARRLNVLTTFEALEPKRTGLAARAEGPVLFTGPCLGERTGRPGDERFPWERLAGPGRTVFVSLGTVFNDQPRLLETLLAGVHRAGARAIVAAGAAAARAARMASADDVVVRWAPQVELLPRVDAFVTHGGNNSTTEALRAGTPLVVVPFGAEQRGNAQRVTRLGVGEGLTESIDPASVAAALTRSFARQEHARALAARLPAEDGTLAFVAALGA